MPREDEKPERVSLGRLDPVEALKALLAVDPAAPASEQDGGKKPSPKPVKPGDGE